MTPQWISLGQGQEITAVLKTVGEVTIRCRVSDPYGAYQDQEFKLNVLNVPPQLDPIIVDSWGNQVLHPIENKPYFINTQATDPGDEALTFEFGPQDNENIALGESQDALCPITFKNDGTYALTITANDGYAETTSTYNVTVTNLPPQIRLSSNPNPAEEGRPFTVTAKLNKPYQDQFTVTWINLENDNQDTQVQSEEDLIQQITLPDNISYNITAKFKDETGAEDQYTLLVRVENVAPEIKTESLPAAWEGVPYNALITAIDPGVNDAITYELLSAPSNMTFDPETGIISFTPTYEQYLQSPLTITVRAKDNNDTASQAKDLLLEILFKDNDEDLMADGWEESYNAGEECDEDHRFDLTSADDALLDFDDDGLVNVREFEFGSHPCKFDGPALPLHVSPENQLRIADATPELVVSTGEFKLPFDLMVTYQLCTSKGCPPNGELIYQSDPIKSEGHQATWTIPENLLSEDSTYAWRAKSQVTYITIEDEEPFGSYETPWTEEWTFRVNETNSAPSAPTPRTPRNDSVVHLVRPVLEVAPSTDKDGDEIEYRFRIYRGTDASASIVTNGKGTVSNKLIQFTPNQDLKEDVPYSWDVVAVDALGSISAPSERWTFTVNTHNKPPSKPTAISISPMDGEFVASFTPTFTAEGSEDKDDDVFSYVFTVYEGTDAIVQSDPIPAVNGKAEFTLTDVNLKEDQSYELEIFAQDPSRAASETVRQTFFVSTSNGKPTVPELLSPADGAQILLKEAFFSWAESSDPEGGTILYRFTYDCDISGHDESLPKERFTTQSLVNKLKEGDTCTWYVEALDNRMLSSGFTQRTFTVISTDDGGSDDGCSQIPGQSRSWPLWILGFLPIALRRRNA